MWLLQNQLQLLRLQDSRQICRQQYRLHKEMPHWYTITPTQYLCTGFTCQPGHAVVCRERVQCQCATLTPTPPPQNAPPTSPQVMVCSEAGHEGNWEGPYEAASCSGQCCIFWLCHPLQYLTGQIPAGNRHRHDACIQGGVVMSTQQCGLLNCS